MAVKTQPKNTTYIEFDLAQSLTFSSYKFVYEYSYLEKRVHVPKKKKKCKPSSGYSGYRKSRLKFVTHHSSPLLEQYFPAVYCISPSLNIGQKTFRHVLINFSRPNSQPQKWQ